MLHLIFIITNILCFFLQPNLSFAESIDCIPAEGNPKACKCNATHCDNITKIDWCPEEDVLLIYTTSDAGARIRLSKAYFRGPCSDAQFTITIDPCTTYQTIFGFGGALTDAAAIVISCLPESAKMFLMNNYFNCEVGLAYNMIRINLGACDFSTELYTYCDSSNSTCASDYSELSCFKLPPVDTEKKIPLLQLAMKISCRCIHIKGATWNTPKWMTITFEVSTSDITPLIPEPYRIFFPPSILKSFVREECYEAWANYYIKTIEAFQFCNLNCSFTLSVGNEPFIALVSIGFTPDGYKKFLTEFLCPKIQKLNLNCTNPIRILILDDQTPFLPIIQTMLKDEKVKSCVDCVGTHWYLDFNTETTKKQHEIFSQQNPDICLWRTESTIAWIDGAYNKPEWDQAAKHARDIISVYYAGQAYIDWNLALDLQGGPNWQNNYCQAAIKVNCSNGEFYKRILFYVFGHFSKFLIPGKSIRVKIQYEEKKDLPSIGGISDLQSQSFYYIAFKVFAPDCKRPNLVVIILNQNDYEVKGDICVAGYDCATIKVPAKSIISTVSTIPCEVRCS